MLNALILLAVAVPQETPSPSHFSGLIGTWKGKSSGMFGNGETTRTYKWSASKAFINYESTTKFEGEPEPHLEFGHISYDASAKRAVLREFMEMGACFKYVQSAENGWSFKSVEAENSPMPGATTRYEWNVSKDTFTEKFYMTMDGKEELALTTEFKRQAK